MSTPMTPAQWRAALKAEGVPTSYISGWDKATSGRDDETGKTFGPVNGIVIHHDAGKDDLAVIRGGTASLPGPLAHTWISKKGIAHVITWRRANHAGTVPANVRAAMIAESGHPRPDAAEPYDGNDFTYGVEVENLGNGTDTYTQVQYDTWVRWAAAICRFHKWSAASVFAHKEVTRRKIDPLGPVAAYGSRGRFTFTPDVFRKDVAQRLAHAASWSPGAAPAPAPAETIESRVSDLEKWARAKGFTG